MNGPSPTLWLNVTTTAGTTAPPMGITRVERMMARELPALCGGRLCYCVWRSGDFVEWKPAAGGGDAPAAGRSLPWGDAPSERRAALGTIGKALITLAPRRLQDVIKRALVGILDGCRSIRRARGGGSPPHRAPHGAIFQPGDVLVSLGLDWAQPAHLHFGHLRATRRIRVVTCCYDLIPVLYPQQCAEDLVGLFTSYFFSIADSSDLILCISRQSEADLLGFLSTTGRPAPPTCVIPLGDSVAGGEEGVVSEEVKRLCGEPFVLFVSTIERRKNHEVLYRAYHLLCAGGHRAQLPKLVFVGARGWGVNDFLTDLELDPLTRGLIVILDRASDRELALLYAKAKFCVYPSFYEGWGLPVGEALAAGKVVVASDRGSLPEVGGELVRYVDPWNPHAWAAEIRHLLDEPGLLSSLERRVRETYRPRTWRASALAVRHAIDALSAVLPSA
jgi:glycosyltransferase involved in cell wall biosynthesis